MKAGDETTDAGGLETITEDEQLPTTAPAGQCAVINTAIWLFNYIQYDIYIYICYLDIYMHGPNDIGLIWTLIC